MKLETILTEGATVADRGGRSAPQRNQAIEALRIAAAFGIIGFHAHAAFEDVAYAGLVVFLVLSPMLDVKINWERVRSTKGLMIAIMLPWAFWCVIYGALNIVAHKPLFPPGSLAGGVLTGTSIHLWFLPFLFGVLLILNLLKTRCSPQLLFWSSTFMGAALLATVAFWRPLSVNWPVPLPQWMHSAPVIFIGIAMGLMTRVGNSAFLGGAILAAALSVAIAASLPGISVTYPVGILSVVLALFIGDRPSSTRYRVQSLANCMMGVYLIHIPILAAVSRLTGAQSYVTVTITFIVSLAVVWIVRRMIVASRLVLG